jgi:hypothetical protein
VAKEDLTGWGKQDEDDGRFRCESSFGMSGESLGQATFSEWVDATGCDRIEGSWISMDETAGFAQHTT